MLEIGILASGDGSNAQSIMDSCKSGYIPGAKVVCVICNNADAFVLERARKSCIPAIHLCHRAFSGREHYDEALVNTLRSFNVKLVALAGFMRIVTPVLLDAFPDAVMNIHPALLPAFPGLHAQRQALHYGVKHSGCTVHFVDRGTDTGPIIIQETVPVLSSDTEQTLTARILKEEHAIYPEAIRRFAAKELLIVDNGCGRKIVHTVKA